jgi:PAS domain S-box-containing protein
LPSSATSWRLSPPQYARDLILLPDVNGVILWTSPSCRDILGYEPEAMIGRRADDFVHPDDRDRHREAHRRRIADRQTKSIKLRLLRVDGSMVDIETVGVPVVSAGGFVDRVVITARDVTDRKMLERRIRVIMDQLPANVWTTDCDLTITSSAGGGLSTVGVRPGEAVGVPLARYLADDERRDKAIENHRRALNGEHLAYETRWRDRDLHVRMHPLRDDQGEIAGTIGISFDITELRRAERRFRLLFERNVAGVFRLFGYGSPAEMVGIHTPSIAEGASARSSALSFGSSDATKCKDSCSASRFRSKRRSGCSKAPAEDAGARSLQSRHRFANGSASMDRRATGSRQWSSC